MSRSSISRGPRTVLIGIGLFAVYLVYTRLTSPWLVVERAQTTLPKASRPQERSTVYGEQSRKWFAKDPWVQKANARFRDGDRLLYFDKHKIDDNHRTISVNPVAFLWLQEDGKDPITVTAESAKLESSSEFSFQEAKFGKIVFGSLNGDVRITGPDGLSIEGRNFRIAEDAMKVWTNQPVNFAWGSHSGRAESGAEIELLPSKDSAKSGLMAVDDVQKIRLLGRIHCNLNFEDDNEDESLRDPPVQLKVSAANGFEFFVPTKEATFLGFMDAKANLDNQVLVERPTATGTLDRMRCSKLALKFHPKIDDSGRGDAPTKLTLDSIVAEGHPVEFWTMKDDTEQVYASMGVVRYHLRTRLLELTDRLVAASGQRIPLEVHQGGTRLSTDYVLLGLDPQNEVHTVECRGEGKIGPSSRMAAPPEKKIFGAAWKKSMLFRRGDEQRITLTGEARVVQASMQPSGKLQSEFSLSSNVMDLYLEPPDSETADQGVSADGMQDHSIGLNMSKIRPRQLIATGNVSMSAQELSGQAREKLVAVFQKKAAGALPNDETLPTADSKAGRVSTVSQSSDKSTTRVAGKNTFLSDTIEVVVNMTESGQPEFQDVWLKGGVEVSHKSPDSSRSPNESRDFSASGNALFAKGGFKENTEIKLFGTPATILNEKNRIEGPRIDLTEQKSAAGKNEREVLVEGSGRIRIVSNTGLDGKPLAKPSPIDIYWGDHMSFSGRTAHFVGNIRAVMNNEMDHDIELTCAGLKVHFAKDVQLDPTTTKEDEFEFSTPDDAMAPAGGIERIECESRVIVKIDVMEAGVVKAHHYAEFADLQFNQITGEFNATGPGLIESVQPETGKRKLATTNRTVARSNTPVKTSEEAFYFIRADFIGEMNGNAQKSFVRLKQHIRGVFGPVRLLTDRLNIDALSTDELPENTGALECENLSISAIPGTTADQSESFSLVAESNASGTKAGTRSPCRFESKLFAGLADKIKYDHSKQQFILLADEGRQATVSYHPDGGKQQVLNGGRFEYYTDRNHLNANQITGVQSTGDLSVE